VHLGGILVLPQARGGRDICEAGEASKDQIPDLHEGVLQTLALRPPNGLVANAWSQPCAVLRLRLSEAIKRVATIAQAMSCNGFVQKRGARA
jgi:hypothetical protein